MHAFQEINTQQKKAAGNQNTRRSQKRQALLVYELCAKDQRV